MKSGTGGVVPYRSATAIPHSGENLILPIIIITVSIKKQIQAIQNAACERTRGRVSHLDMQKIHI
jgi:hypothetical protein